MPVGENFWNPYRWVTLSNRPVEHDVPHYHHTFSGLSGRLWCELKALTPLLIGDGQVPNIQFVRHPHNRQPYIPGTSLKGAVRSSAEVIGNGYRAFSSFCWFPAYASKCQTEHERGFSVRHHNQNNSDTCVKVIVMSLRV